MALTIRSDEDPYYEPLAMITARIAGEILTTQPDVILEAVKTGEHMFIDNGDINAPDLVKFAKGNLGFVKQH